MILNFLETCMQIVIWRLALHFSLPNWKDEERSNKNIETVVFNSRFSFSPEEWRKWFHLNQANDKKSMKISKSFQETVLLTFY